MNNSYDFYGQFTPPVDQYLFTNWPYLAEKSQGYIIEAGALDGITECSTYFFEKYFQRRVINIEPDPVWFSRLTINRPSAINLNFALSNNSGTLDFTRVIHPEIGDRLGHGSIQHKRKHLNYLKNINCQFINTPVQAITYAQVIHNLKIDRVDLMVLDVEGHEVSVIKGFRDTDYKSLPAILCVEVGWTSLLECRILLKRFGYSFHSKHEVNAFFVNNKLLKVIKND